MNPSNVYFTDFHTIAFGDSLPTKLKKLIKKAGIENLDLDGKFVAIKMHFGELGNTATCVPIMPGPFVDVVKELGGSPSLQTVIPCIRVAEKMPWSIWSAHGKTALLL